MPSHRWHLRAQINAQLDGQLSGGTFLAAFPGSVDRRTETGHSAAGQMLASCRVRAASHQAGRRPLRSRSGHMSRRLTSVIGDGRGQLGDGSGTARGQFGDGSETARGRLRDSSGTVREEGPLESRIIEPLTTGSAPPPGRRLDAKTTQGQTAPKNNVPLIQATAECISCGVLKNITPPRIPHPIITWQST